MTAAEVLTAAEVDALCGEMLERYEAQAYSVLPAAPACTMADLVGPELAVAAGDVAEALETARQWPLVLLSSEVDPGTEDERGEFVPGSWVRITAATPEGTEVEITVRLTGRTVRDMAAELAGMEDS